MLDTDHPANSKDQAAGAGGAMTIRGEPGIPVDPDTNHQAVEAPIEQSLASTGTTVPAPIRRVFARPRSGGDYRLRGLDLSGPSDTPAPRRQRRPDSLRRRHQRHLAIKWLAVVLISAGAAALFRIAVIQPFTVPSATMLPTLQVGDRILVLKWSALAGAISRGDIIVFRRPALYPCGGGGDGSDLVTRVLAMPGQRIWSVGSRIFVDGSPLSEPHWYYPRFGEVGPVPVPRTIVPANDYYVMGDNRADSCDSRSFGPVPKSMIVGKVVAILVRANHVHFQLL